MGFLIELEGCIPASPPEEIPWGQIERLLAGTPLEDLKNTPQNPAFHGEGDVYTHTRMVCEELIRLPAYLALEGRQKTELFLAALLHDIGKAKTTRLEEGAWVSPHHASTGSLLAREFLWRDMGLCGTPEDLVFRETVCALIRFHMLPFHLTEQEEPERRVRETAALGELAEDFSWQLLCLLAEADARGRIAPDREDSLVQVELARLLAEEAGCLYGPFPFPCSHTRYAYLSGRRVPPDQVLYDDTWGEVILLSGLPGTGKDTWIRQHHPEGRTVSLDDLRRVLHVKPTDSQGAVIQAAQEQAREHLRKKEPFLWNSTNLTPDLRQKLIRLFEQYGARVRIVYLETGLETRAARNTGRAEAVPEDVVRRMLGKTIPPTPLEAQTVEWICV